ncbi:MAG: type II toxin-antitoxin system RelE/ParE family toxin [Verrucomicrobiaceae bacterium]|nr:MAG: type II toxin-antitoxin system RelE/ParE family toxin [Verrucomicrobiaceae bacterium]
MAFRIVWSDTALADLRDLIRYIARDDRQVAKRFGDLIIAKLDSLQTFPRIGKIVPEYREDRLRELILPPYRIVYEIEDDSMVISILRIWHGARGDLEMPG